MITLSSAHDYVVLFAIAALFGAIGGIAYELTQRRSNETGSIELPGFRGKRFIELGVFSSVILGAVAAVAISYFFTPEVQVKSAVTGAIQTKWQIVKVIPLSLIVGSAGGAFLEAMRGRILGQLNAQKVATTQAVGTAGVTQVGQLASTLATTQLTEPRAKIIHTLTRSFSDLAEGVPVSFKAGLSPLIEGAPHRAKIDEFIASYKQPAPVSDHVERVSGAIDEAIVIQTQTASDLIDGSVKSAIAAIDAAATA